MSKWRYAAQAAIDKAIEQCRSDGIIPSQGKMSDEQKKEFKKRIDAAYPFGAREMHPYKIWLEVRRQTFYWYGCLESLPQVKAQKTKAKKQEEVSGQQSLF